MSNAVVAEKVLTNKLVVREIPGSSHYTFDQEAGGFCSVSDYEMVSCDIDPALKELVFVLGPLPASAFTPELAKLMANSPRERKTNIDAPSARIDDVVLDLMRERGVEVEYLR